MDESFGAQYALQIALQTLKERCQQFQQRITILEEENINLRSKNNINQLINEGSLPEVDSLKQQIIQLTEEKMQLSNNFQMVSAENRRLWVRLSKLTQVNENLGSKLTKINNTLVQHNNTSQNQQTTLIRSKTFTQDEPHIKLIPKKLTDDNDKISLELEDISLKLISTIAKEKTELELQCSQMTEIQNTDANFINSFAFIYPTNEVDNAGLNEFDSHLNTIKNLKQILIKQQKNLEAKLDNLKAFKCENNTIIRKKLNNTVTVSVQTIYNTDNKTSNELDFTKCESSDSSPLLDNNVSTNSKISLNTTDKICPVCSKIFGSNFKFNDFEIHVESHFIVDTDSISNFEIIP